MKKLFEILFAVYGISAIYFLIFIFFIPSENKNILIMIVINLIILSIVFRLTGYILQNNINKRYKEIIKTKFFQDVEEIKNIFIQNFNIIIFLVISLVFSYCIWKQIPKIFNMKDEIVDLGKDLFFNFLFIGITVFTIDYMKEKTKKEEEKPIKEAVYDRVAKIFERFNFLCLEMCRYSKITEEIQNIEELYIIKNFEQIFENLDLEHIPDFISSMGKNWKNFIKSITDFIESEWKVLISLYYLIEPELYNQIDNFFEKNRLLKMMRNIEDIKKVIGKGSTKKLSKYAEVFLVDKDALEISLKEILKMMKIFNEEYKRNWDKEIELKHSKTKV